MNKRGLFRTVNIKNVPPFANIFGGRFVCAIKDLGVEKEATKVRYAPQGHRDIENSFIFHNTTTLRKCSIKIIVSTCAVINFHIFSHDVRQAYFQHNEDLTREIYLKPKERDKKYFDVAHDEVLRLIQPLCGTPDSGDY